MLGTKELNKILQEKLNPNINKEPEKASMGAIFRTGDRVMQIKNNYDINWERKLFGEKEIGSGVFNGEIGTILKVDEKEKQIEIKFDDEKIIGTILSFPIIINISFALVIPVYNKFLVRSIGDDCGITIITTSNSLPLCFMYCYCIAMFYLI